MSSGALLWIHGKRKLLLYVVAAQNLMVSDLRSGIWEERPLVRNLPTIMIDKQELIMTEAPLSSNTLFRYAIKDGLR